MHRREFITLVGSAAAWPWAAHAQRAEPIRRVGVLTPKQDFIDRNDVAAISREFQRLGWEEGRNFHLEYRAVVPNEKELGSAAAELVELKPEVILAVTSPALKAALGSNDSTPIVFVAVTDPVHQGFLASLDHPGGNITGFTSFDFSIGSKWLKLLKDISPNLRHIALIFFYETTPGGWLPLFKSGAISVGLEVDEVALLSDIDKLDEIALNAMRSSDDAGMIVLPSPFTMLHRQRIIEFAARRRLPAIYWDNRFVEDGGLMSYAYSLDEEERQGVSYVDRILRGEKPGDLPVQKTAKFELVINLKTAKTLGLTVSPILLADAKKVIE